MGAHYTHSLLFPSLSLSLVCSHIDSQQYPGKKTPLLLAVDNISIEGVAQLIKCGASPGITDKEGNTVFHYAALIPDFGDQLIDVIWFVCINLIFPTY